MTKLAQKMRGPENEEIVLNKAFRHFDFNNSNTIDIDEFKKVLERLGIQFQSTTDLKALFDTYDLNKNGQIEYREFASMVTGKRSAVATKPLSTPRNVDFLADALRQKLKTRGASGMIGLGRNFRIQDDNRSGSLSFYEFDKAMTDFQLGFAKDEVEKLFAYFDMDRSGEVDYNEFLRVIRGPMNPAREQLVMQAFNKLDRDGNGHIDYDDLVGLYNGEFHPDVKAGKKTEQQVLNEWLNTFQMHHNMQNSAVTDNLVTKEEFIEYYNNISCSIDRDDYFRAMMISAWDLDGSRAKANAQKAWAKDARVF